MKQLAFIADDFGLSSGVNAAILRAHREGALTGASLMLGQPGTEAAVEFARANPTLEIGWHLHLCDSQPTTRPRWPWGNSPVRAGLLLGCRPLHRALVRAEVRQQWRLFQATGLPCRFVNVHHHLHLHPLVWRTVSEAVAGSAAGWFRGFNYRRFGRGNCTAIVTQFATRLFRPGASAPSPGRPADSVWGLDRLFAMNAAEIASTAAALPEGLHEFIFHPRTTSHDADSAALLALRRTLG